MDEFVDLNERMDMDYDEVIDYYDEEEQSGDTEYFMQ
jgi:hypothetical protein